MFIYQFKRDKLLTQYRLWWPLEEFLRSFFLSVKLCARKKFFLVSEMLTKREEEYDEMEKKGKANPNLYSEERVDLVRKMAFD